MRLTPRMVSPGGGLIAAGQIRLVSIVLEHQHTPLSRFQRANLFSLGLETYAIDLAFDAADSDSDSSTTESPRVDARDHDAPAASTVGAKAHGLDHGEHLEHAEA